MPAQPCLTTTKEPQANHSYRGNSLSSNAYLVFLTITPHTTYIPSRAAVILWQMGASQSNKIPADLKNATVHVALQHTCYQSGETISGYVDITIATGSIKCSKIDIEMKAETFTTVHYTTSSGSGKNRKTVKYFTLVCEMQRCCDFNFAMGQHCSSPYFFDYCLCTATPHRSRVCLQLSPADDREPVSSGDESKSK